MRRSKAKRTAPAGLTSETEVRKCVEALDWPRLERSLAARSWDGRDHDILARIILGCSDLILRYPDANREKRRADFLERLTAAVVVQGGEVAGRHVQAALDVMAAAEAGYRSLLGLLAQSNATTRPASERAAAMISLGAHQVCGVLEAITQHVRTADSSEPVSFALQDADGDRYPGDDVMGMVDATTGAALIMYATQEGWIAQDGAVVLPPLPSVGDAERTRAREVQHLAESWAFWRSMEERCRYEPGTFERRIVEGGDQGGQAHTLLRYRPGPETLAWERTIVASHERLNTEIHGIFHEIAFRSDARSSALGLDELAGLYPDAFVSLSELESAYALDFILSTSIAADRTRYLGLRLVEWLRGYSALALMADQAAKRATGNPDLLVWTVQPETLRRELVRLGLSREQAELFIGHVTFRRTSIDVIDEPLIRMSDGGLLVFAPCLISAVPVRIILSKLARAGVSLESRGRRFEREVSGWFSKWGLRAHAFKIRRDGETYEYDAVVPWGDYVFMFECKSRGPAAPGPVQHHHARATLEAHRAQAARLAQALRQYPDILDKQLGTAQGDRVIIPCVLNALPMALPAASDGVFCTDLPSLGLFFDIGALRLSVTHVVPGLGSIQQRLAERRLWAGTTPMPEDLLDFLRAAPLQAIVLDQLEERVSRVRIGTTNWAETVQIIRPPESIESLTSVMGADAPTARQAIRSFSEALEIPGSGLRSQP